MSYGPIEAIDPYHMQMTKEFEGFEPNIYKDSLGIKSIGHGFNLEDETVSSLLPSDVLSGERGITQPESDVIFNQIYGRARGDAKSFAGEDIFKRLPIEVQGIVTDMAYNMGLTKLDGFVELKKALEKGDWEKSAIEMKDSKWYGQVGDRSKKLINMMLNQGRAVGGY